MWTTCSVNLVVLYLSKIRSFRCELSSPSGGPGLPSVVEIPKYLLVLEADASEPVSKLTLGTNTPDACSGISHT